MTKGMRVLAAAVAAAGAVAVPAVAKERLKTQWMIEGAAAPAAPVRAKPGDAVWTQKLRPAGLAKLAAPYAESGARWRVEAGAELFEAAGAEGAVYCPIDNRDPAKWARILSAAPYREHLCFIDRDRDGRFEISFITVNSYGDLPGVFGRIMPSDKGIAPLAYEVVDPKTFSRDFALTLRYQHRKGDKLSFRVAYGSPDRQTVMIGPSVSIRTLPASFELLGGRFTVREAAGDEILVEIAQPIPERAFNE